MTTATQSRPELPVRRSVEQVMGMPLSLALRGRHAYGAAADGAWTAGLAELREVERIFSRYRSDSFLSRLSAARSGWTTVRPSSARSSRSASGPVSSPAAPSTYAGPRRTVGWCSTRTAS